MAEVLDIEDIQEDPRRGIRRGIYLLPNLITIASLFSGVMGIHWAIQSKFDLAAWAIVLSAIFDSLDGTVARVTKSQSLFGQELDSLADMIAFGATPGLLMFMWALESFGKYGFGAGFLYIACTAMRLARFNVQSGTVERTSFQGLPSPGAAIMIASTILLYYDMGGEGNPSRHVTLLAECYLLALLMVSSVPYISSKALHLESVKAFRTLFFVVLALSFLVAEPIKGLFLFSFLYVASGPVLHLRRLVVRGEPVTRP